MKIAITGGAGFIGSHLVDEFRGRARVVVVDNLRTGRRCNLQGRECEFIEASILEPAALDAAFEGADSVFHLAALVSVPESVERPRETLRINVGGLLEVLEAAARARVRKLVFASSAAVYGERPENPKTEDLPPDPRSPYAITKLDGEYWCAHYARAGLLETACLRFFNVFGPRQDPHSAYAAAIPRFFEQARRGEPLTIYGDGGQTRDFIHVKDIAGALSFVAAARGLTGTFNAGYGSGISILELARAILRLTGSRSEIRHEAPRPGDIRHSTADPSKLLRAGWRPRFDLEGGLADLAAAAKLD